MAYPDPSPACGTLPSTKAVTVVTIKFYWTNSGLLSKSRPSVVGSKTFRVVVSLAN
jgi:hypothetical protein